MFGKVPAWATVFGAGREVDLPRIMYGDRCSDHVRSGVKMQDDMELMLAEGKQLGYVG